MEPALKWIGGLVAVAAVIVGLTVFNGWDEFLEIAGLDTTPIKTVPASQCEDLRDIIDQNETVVRCADSDRAYAHEVREACRDDPGSVEDEFLIGDPRSGEVVAPRCP